ncbi:Acyl-CoA dehydrogenase [Pseudomonas chlororaphis]|uniref:acyl-CoA dehydrogenase family protein n=1 Tax=Pseudomonas chlororaphis TaxID=587753 RepID=UPI0008792819|nr:acyl-CoA dehydrogenase family protein [Pseudomonas chlororaphis]AZD22322.1 Acyl-CoA dehydrogenase [Pseudomonas chlororaphis subsp. aurantiaca]AZD66923.1 Acyl-CoA dehydrogenase [Pseudomonas chlororaphis subsp. aurantiaca]QIT22949.1 acyl-CoA dehydrogenase [Pseudomonas chlororaphis subsp. aurantiaca]QQX61782.1 acyl-CoA dehydrogenase family protein [Pseudomonas chlororaphis subsp. aurantiaca]UVE48593.1 acyl-CoA dehydrogenase family protein [Pseudomonas chlororaphis]
MTAQPPKSQSYSALHERLRPLFERIAAGAIEREQQRSLAFDAVGWLREAGFAALRVPLAHGGAGISLPVLFRLLIDLAAADSNLPQIVRAHFGFVEGRLSSGDSASQAYWFAKVLDGQLWGAAMAERSDSTSNSVRLSAADPQNPGAGWLLDGEKYYCTGAIYADWVAAVAMLDEDFVSVVVAVDAPGVSREDDWDGFGQRLTGSGTTRFQQVAVPSEHVLRRFKPGELRAESYLSAFYQLFHLATLAGIARAVLQDATLFVQGRTRAFGVPGQSSPKDDPLVQRVIGRLSSLAYASETLVLGAAEVLEGVHQAELAGTVREADYVEADIRVYQAQQIVLEQVLEATTLLFEVGGASATSQARRLDRHWRNARTLASHNPAIYRERALGNYYLNGISPGAAWRALHEQDAASGGARDEASAV